MSDVPSNLIPSRITQLPEYGGSSTLGYFPYVIGGVTYKVQFSQVSANVTVPPTRTIYAGTGLTGGGDLSADRTISVANNGIGYNQLALSGVVSGTYGTSTEVATFTVDDKGRVTSASNTPIVLTGYVPTTRQVIAGTGLSGGGDLSSDVTIDVDFSSSSPLPLGTASAGVADIASREDHVHPAVDLSDANETQGVLPLGRGGTGDSLSPISGAVVFSGNTGFSLTGVGTSGQFLKSDGASPPYWDSLPTFGTVTSVNVVGGATGLSTSGGPITSSGTITIAGTLNVSHGGTNATTAQGARENILPSYVGNASKVLAVNTGETDVEFVAAGAGSVTSVGVTAGTGISVSGSPITSSGTITVTNTAPDQIVSLTGGGTTSITGSYPNFTITSDDQYDGTVTSVGVTAGTGISVSGSPITSSGTITVTNTAPDQVVSLTGGGTTSITGSYPNFTITSNDQYDGTVTSVGVTAGTGISVSGSPITSSGTITVTNTAPDQVVSLTGAGTTSISGTYPNFTITSNDQYLGTVTSVAFSGGTTGLTVSGSPITSSGTITLSGTLAAANGGTGISSYAAGDILYASGTTTLSKLTVGTLNQILTSSGTAPQWTSNSSITVGTANNIAGGIASQIPYQSSAGTTAFIANGTAGQVLVSAGTSAPAWGGVNGGTF